MKNIGFLWNCDQPPLEVLFRPLRQITVELDGIDRPFSVHLWHDLSGAVLIQSQMFDIAPRIEVGALGFWPGRNVQDKVANFVVPEEAREIIKVEKLIIQERGVDVESGVVLTNTAAEELIIVAAAAPYGLAVRIPWSNSLKFSPEYDLGEYRRAPLE